MKKLWHKFLIWTGIKEEDNYDTFRSILRSEYIKPKSIILTGHAVDTEWRKLKEPKKRIFKVEVGNMDSKKALAEAEKFKRNMYSKPLVDTNTGDIQSVDMTSFITTWTNIM